MPTLISRRPNSYYDSGVLMRLAERLQSEPGVNRAAALMGTPANLALLARQGFAQTAAEPSELVVAIDATTQEAAEQALQRVEAHLSHRPPVSATGRSAPHTLTEALAQAPQSNLLVLSTPGAYAAREAREALSQGLHVFMFSDNVPIEDEVALKSLARERGLLLMGPDCGTALIGGQVLGFGNRVRRGDIGLVGASGTGIQEVSSLIDRFGAGVAHAIGTGGRDLKDAVGGIMTCFALERLAASEDVKVLVLISKPPGQRALAQLAAVIPQLRQPVISCLPGLDDAAVLAAGALPTHSLEEAAARAVQAAELAKAGRTRSQILDALRQTPWDWSAGPLATEDAEPTAELRRAVAALRPEQRRVRGLYSGGTLSQEATRMLPGSGHKIIDLGDDEFTQGRAHPMIDPRTRNEYIAATGTDPQVGVLLLDVVLGIGSHADPAAALLPALAAARAEAKARALVACAAVVGTDADPQPRHQQVAKLREAGVLVFSSHARMVRAVAEALSAQER